MPTLSVPSWVIPGTYAENLRFLESKKEIRGVELLFFLYNDEIRSQFDSEWDKIRGYAERFTFTAHLPEFLLPEHEALIARLAPLARHFVIHPDAENPASQAALLKSWKERYGAVFLAENIFQGKGVSSLEALLPHLDEDFALCMDTGHLLLDGKSPSDFFKARQNHQNRIGEIHLHSLDHKRSAVDGRLTDHRRLREDDPWLLELLPLLKGYQGIINLEVFSWEEVEAGIEVLRKLGNGEQGMGNGVI
jgi:sugar phosphate isomerase/epimerase